MTTRTHTQVRRTAPQTASRLGANARKREETRQARRAEVRRGAASGAARFIRTTFLVVLAIGSAVGSTLGLRELALRRGWIELRDIEVAGFSKVGLDETVSLMGVHRGVPLTDLSIADIRARLEAHPWIQSAQVTRSFPHRLRVVLRERRAVASLDDGRWVARDGRILDPRGTTVPVHVVGLAGDSLNIHPSAMGLVAAITQMENLSPDLSQRFLDMEREADGSLSFQMADFSPRLRIRPDGWRLAVARARAIARELGPEQEKIAEIDLRHGACAALRRKEGGA
ncbi:MAG: FtsQ-type POTRA domain-containing protein [Fibrobacteria bacterium]|nr:FtsQ-type POTRA domain-containing protein [Fibrobacteria bacterium]